MSSIDKRQFIALLERNAPDLDVNNLGPESRLADIGLDSLGFNLLLWDIERVFGLADGEVRLDALDGNSTIADVIATFKASGHQIEV